MDTRDEMILAQQIDDLEVQRAKLIDDLMASRLWRQIEKKACWPRPWNPSRHGATGFPYPCRDCGEPCTQEGKRCAACFGKSCRKQVANG